MNKAEIIENAKQYFTETVKSVLATSDGCIFYMEKASLAKQHARLNNLELFDINEEKPEVKEKKEVKTPIKKASKKDK